MRRTALALVLLAAITACGGSGGSTNAKAPVYKVKTVLDTHGSGATQTRTFTVADQWSIHYSFTCSGKKGNFGISVLGEKNSESLSNSGTTQIAEKSGNGVVHNSHGGRFSLSVYTECRWTITVVSGR